MSQTLNQLFHSTAARLSSRPALRFKSDGGWKDLTWAQVEEAGMQAANGLLAEGLVKGERIGLLSNTRPEWLLADLGSVLSGAATVTLYQSNTAEECAYIISNSELSLVFAEDETQLAKLQSVRSEIPSVKRVVLFSGEGDGDWSLSFDSFLAQGETYAEQNPSALETRENSIGADDLCCLIYTSGTTGRPKGVVLTHENFVYEGNVIRQTNILGEDDVQLLFLPLAHVFAQVLKASWFSTGHLLAVTGIDTLLDDMAAVKPTMMAAVPRIFEKIYSATMGKARGGDGLAGKLANWALDHGEKMAEVAIAGGRPQGLGWTIAKGLVYKKIGVGLQEKFGGRLRFFVSGGAPLSKKINWFFSFAGVEILEGYGMTETTAATCCNLPGTGRIGTVGAALPGMEVKIAEDGEILMRGPGIMKEYWRMEEATAETIIDGWLHSGDIGELDEDGYLRITDRKKDIIITAGGKNVAPQPVEGELAASQFIGHAVVHGDQRKFLSALVTLDMDNIKAYAEANGFSVSDREDACKNATVVALIQGIFDKVNAGLPKYSTIKKFALVPVEFEAGTELTPSLKVKRRLVEKKFVAYLDGMYEG
ncbi:MAG: long-chain fatty acid--CoA ligase [Myxococcota bacterium]|nr:long-chain fatty acid--CoA ligase [Myxococcota bacterium]